MVLIVALLACWLGAFLVLVALTTMASRSDRPTAEHLARAGLWLPPSAEHDRPAR